MKGYAHYIWSASAFVVAMLIITSIFYPVGDFRAIIIASIATFISIAFQTRSSRKEREYKALKGKNTTSKEQKKRMRRSYLATREISAGFLLIALVFLIYFHSMRALSRLDNFDEAVIMTGFLFSYIGSVVPDSDLMLGVENHRSKYTHSALIPSTVAIVCLFFTNEALMPICMLLFGLTVGAALHLFCDVVPEGSNVREAVVSFIKWDKTPGDIRGIKENKEQAYLIINGLILVVFSILFVLRQLSGLCDFPPIMNNGVLSISTLSIGLFAFSIFLFMISIIMMLTWRSKPKNSNS
ncbi:MAG: hypothetical protein ACFFHV_13050 [Promethearchaeota archaeon]